MSLGPGGGDRMIAAYRALMFAFVISGAGMSGAAFGLDHAPMQKAIDIHKKHLSTDSPMPEQSTQGQQTAIDHLVRSQERWLSAEHEPEPDDVIREFGEFGIL